MKIIKEKENLQDNGALLEFKFYYSCDKKNKSLITFKLAIIEREENFSTIRNIPHYGYVCVEDNNLYITNFYSGGQTGVGVSVSDIKKFNEHSEYSKETFIKFIL